MCCHTGIGWRQFWRVFLCFVGIYIVLTFSLYIHNSQFGECLKVETHEDESDISTKDTLGNHLCRHMKQVDHCFDEENDGVRTTSHQCRRRIQKQQALKDIFSWFAPGVVFLVFDTAYESVDPKFWSDEVDLGFTEYKNIVIDKFREHRDRYDILSTHQVEYNDDLKINLNFYRKEHPITKKLDGSTYEYYQCGTGDQECIYKYPNFLFPLETVEYLKLELFIPSPTEQYFKLIYEGDDNPYDLVSRGKSGKPYFWLIWHGKLKGDWLHMCLESHIRHNSKDFEVVVLNRTNLDKYGLSIHPNYARMPKFGNHLDGDHLSAIALAKHGGVYYDLDSISFSSAIPMLKKVTKYQYQGIWYPKKSQANRGFLDPSHGVQWVRKNNLLHNLWLRSNNEKLSKFDDYFVPFKKHHWNEFHRTTFRPHLIRMKQNYQIRFFYYDSYNYFNPLGGCDTGAKGDTPGYTDRKKPIKTFWRKARIMLILCNTSAKLFGKLTRAQILQSPILIARMFQRALGYPVVAPG